MTNEIPKNFCTAPWRSLYVSPNGSVGACCIYKMDKEHAYGNINDTELNDIMHGSNIRNIKTQLLNGERPSACNECWIKEDAGLPSFRSTWLRRDKDLVQHILQNHDAHSEVEDLNISHWDIRPNNICNLSCIICTPELSSGVWQLKHDLGDAKWLNTPKFLKIKRKKFDSVLEYIKLNVLENKKIGVEDRFYFAGGEPLIMPEHKEIMDFLVEEELFDVSIFYNTNMTSLEFKGTEWLDVWKKFRNKIEIVASIDGTGDVAEIQRLGTNWESIKKNLTTLSQNLDVIHIKLSMVITIITYPKLVESLLELEEIFGREHLTAANRVDFVMTTHPTELSLASINSQYIDRGIANTVAEMGYDTTSIVNFLDNMYSFELNNERNDWWRTNLFQKLYNHKGIDIREIIDWIPIVDGECRD